uniref:Uncharacterized protein n=1 Tax=Zea mays TaxID=4577 RepID=A0A804RFR3_MAIZE
MNLSKKKELIETCMSASPKAQKLHTISTCPIRQRNAKAYLWCEGVRWLRQHTCPWLTSAGVIYGNKDSIQNEQIRYLYLKFCTYSLLVPTLIAVDRHVHARNNNR